MKIDIFTTADISPRFFNLKTTETEAILKEFTRRNVSLKIYSRTAGSYESSNIFPLSRLISKFLTFLQVYGISQQARYLNVWLLDAFSAQKVRCDADLVFSMLGFSPLLFAKTRGRKIFYCPASHWVVYQKLYLEECNLVGFSCEKSFLSKQTQKFVDTVELTDRLIVLSEEAKRTYLSEGVPESKVVVVSCGVDFEKYTFENSGGKEKNSKFRVLMVADCTILKGLQYLLEAWKHFLSPEFELNVVGYLDPCVKKMVKKYPQYQNVFYRGHTDPIPYYQQADVFVLPSLSEGSAKVIYEALASGIPSIVTDRCGSGHLIEDGKNGLIVPIRDKEALAEKIEYLYQHPGERREMGRLSQEKVSRFTWEKFGQNMVKVLLS